MITFTMQHNTVVMCQIFWHNSALNPQEVYSIERTSCIIAINPLQAEKGYFCPYGLVSSYSSMSVWTQ